MFVHLSIHVLHENVNKDIIVKWHTQNQKSVCDNGVRGSLLRLPPSSAFCACVALVCAVFG